MKPKERTRRENAALSGKKDLRKSPGSGSGPRKNRKQLFVPDKNRKRKSDPSEQDNPHDYSSIPVLKRQDKLADARTGNKWSDSIYVSAYEFARAGMSDTNIAKAVGTTLLTFRRWEEKRPALKEAIARGRNCRERTAASDFAGFLRSRLPPDLIPLLDKLTAWEKEPNGVRKMEKLLAGHGKRARQLIFLYALPANGFNISRACRFACVNRNTYSTWVLEEPEFGELIGEVLEARKDAYEEFLYNAAQAGSDAAILFANKSLNRDRGYGEKVQVEVSGHVKHSVAVIDLSQVKLPLEVRLKMIEACRDAGLMPHDPTKNEEDVLPDSEEEEVETKPVRNLLEEE